MPIPAFSNVTPLLIERQSPFVNLPTKMVSPKTDKPVFPLPEDTIGATVVHVRPRLLLL